MLCVQKDILEVKNEDIVWIETFTGKRVNPLHMRPEDLDIRDIAHALSQLCRFTGHCKFLYTVGMHSILVAERMEAGFISSPTDCLAALLHDATEAYLNDMSRPTKNSIGQYKEVENRLMGAVVDRFDLHGADWTEIKKIDNALLATEAEQLMPSRGLGWWLPEVAVNTIIPKVSCEEVEETFLERFRQFGGA